MELDLDGVLNHSISPSTATVRHASTITPPRTTDGWEGRGGGGSGKRVVVGRWEQRRRGRWEVGGEGKIGDGVDGEGLGRRWRGGRKEMGRGREGRSRFRSSRGFCVCFLGTPVPFPTGLHLVAQAFLSQISPTQMVGGFAQSMLYDGGGRECNKASPFDFSSALHDLEHSCGTTPAGAGNSATRAHSDSAQAATPCLAFPRALPSCSIAHPFVLLMCCLPPSQEMAPPKATPRASPSKRTRPR